MQELESDSVPPPAEAPTDPAPKPTDSEKIDSLLELVGVLADHVLRLDANVQLIRGKQEEAAFDVERINRKLGVIPPETSIALSLMQLEAAVSELSSDVQVIREHTEKEASYSRESIRALEQAEEKRAAGGNGR